MCDNVLFPAPPLSVENVMAVLETLPWKRVGDELHVPSSKLDAIASENSTDRQRLAAVVRYWILRDPFASWRRLIHALDDKYKDGLYYDAEDDDDDDDDDDDKWHDVADRIRKYAEKQTGE